MFRPSPNVFLKTRYRCFLEDKISLFSWRPEIHRYLETRIRPFLKLESGCKPRIRIRNPGIWSVARDDASLWRLEWSTGLVPCLALAVCTYIRWLLRIRCEWVESFRLIGLFMASVYIDSSVNYCCFPSYVRNVFWATILIKVSRS